MTLICPACRRRLVYVVLVVAGTMYKTWQCDCNYRNPEDEATVPGNIIAEICRAREWDEGSVCIYEHVVRQ